MKLSVARGPIRRAPRVTLLLAVALWGTAARGLPASEVSARSETGQNATDADGNGPAAAAGEADGLYLVPNFHDACMGWLVSYAQERSFGLYSYLAHLDRVTADPHYHFVLSEIPHLLAMADYEPERWAELRQRMGEGRVELVNAFVLEPTVSLSGGEALVQQGVQGLRWYDQMFAVRPRYAWMIDLCGWHEQMAQITAGLGLDAFVYCRFNPTGGPPQGEPALTNWDDVKCGQALHWITSPDGSRVVAVSPGLYCDVDLQPAFRTQQPLSAEQLQALIQLARANRQRFPNGLPLLLLGGEWDYSLPFRYPGYPAELVRDWNATAADLPLHIATFSQYMDRVLPVLREGAVSIPSAMASGRYGWSAFWISAPAIKQRYRGAEHRLQAAEMTAAAASLVGTVSYPSQELANAWFLMALNMDRNVLWGAGVDASFADDHSWDTRDRFEYVEHHASRALEQSLAAVSRPAAASVVLLNTVTGRRAAPVELRLPANQQLAGVPCQSAEDAAVTLVDLPLESLGVTTARLEPRGALAAPADVAPEAVITTRYYDAQLDPQTGALRSLRLKPSGREVLGGPANVVLAESPSDVHNTPPKAARKLLPASPDAAAPTVSVVTGPVATMADIRSRLPGGGALRRVVRFYRNSPRIDFHTELSDVPGGTVVSVEFPLADTITQVRRGIPYGFSHGGWAGHHTHLPGVTQGILPAIRYSDYTLAGGGGVAILDRGVPGRELVGKTPILLLHNTSDAYALSWKIHDRPFSEPSTWLSGRGRQVFEYALYAHDEDWSQARVPQMAWEYNSPVFTACDATVADAQVWVETSDNVILEAMRRDGDELELRLVECLGQAGPAAVTVRLPHGQAFQTDLLGGHRQVLAGGPRYRLTLRPQQIVTLRLTAASAVSPVAALRSLQPVVPPAKWEFLHNARNPRLVGHPPAADAK